MRPGDKTGGVQTEWVMVQVGAGQSSPRELPRGTTLLVATAVRQNTHMAVHTLEDQQEDTGHLVVHQHAGPVWEGGGSRLPPQ